MEKETNFFDLCKACAQAIYRGVQWILHIVAEALRLTFRQWWVVFFIIAGIVAGFLYSRPANRWYPVNAVAILNGPTVEAAKEHFLALEHFIPGSRLQNRSTMLHISDSLAMRMTAFRCFYVIDSKHDGTADFVDYAERVPATDTLDVRMPNMIGLRFYTRAVDALPELEEHIMAYMNSNRMFREAYEVVKPSIDRQYRYEQEQFEKLDSLTTAFYFDQAPAPTGQKSNNPWSSAFVVGDRRIKLFTEDIDEFAKRKALHEQMYAYSQAPVVLRNHFVADHKPINSRTKSCAIGLLLGWLLGCCIAALVEKRKQISAFLKQ